ncbi:MAG: cytochrome c3 family protein [Burkholderiaceae bacterium]
MNTLTKIMGSTPTLLAAIGLAFAATFAQAQTLKPQHSAMAGHCTACHGTSGQFLVPDDKACLTCHGSYAELVKKSEAKLKQDRNPEPNPHASGHYGDSLNCTACHKEHQAAEVYCNHCHEFTYPRMKK